MIGRMRNTLKIAVAGTVLSLASAGAAITPVAGATGPTGAKPIAIKVYKTPQCGCCKGWVKHLRDNGFQVETMDMPDLSLIKQKYGVKPALQACHTAIVNGYVVEGHVPADVILKLLKERPAVAGVAVPGMPMGSPGMEGGSKQPYDIYTFDRAGRSRVYAHR
jgi:hypothetical protein